MLTRSALVAGAVVAAYLLAPPVNADGHKPPVDGWGSTDCDQTPSPACELGAGTGGNGPGQAPRPDGGGTGGIGSGGGGGDAGYQRPSGDQSLSPGTNLKNCRYVKSDYQPPSGGVVPAAYTAPAEPTGGVVPASYKPSSSYRLAANVHLAQQQDESGSWYVYRCTGPDGARDGLYRPPVFIADGQAPPGGAPLPSPEELARQAYKQLRLPSPSIAASPEGPQLVRLPTWLWIEDGWGPVSATASVPGVSVTATASPESVRWSMGDGGVRTCNGKGTPYSDERDPRSASPDCGYTYRSASGDGGFRVTATIRWGVSWSGAGQSGTFDGLTTSTSTTFVVEEVGAVNGR